MQHFSIFAAKMVCYTQNNGPNSLEMMNKEVTKTKSTSDPELQLLAPNRNVLVSLIGGKVIYCCLFL